MHWRTNVYFERCLSEPAYTFIASSALQGSRKERFIEKQTSKRIGPRYQLNNLERNKNNNMCSWKILYSMGDIPIENILYESKFLTPPLIKSFMTG